MSRTVEEREIDIWGREVQDVWKGPWCGVGDFYVRHVLKDGIFDREIVRAWPNPEGVKYDDLPD